jgi:hypothetical protein
MTMSRIRLSNLTSVRDLSRAEMTHVGGGFRFWPPQPPRHCFWHRVGWSWRYFCFR